jgi:predicted MPP superfamily phosphohydrolase
MLDLALGLLLLAAACVGHVAWMALSLNNWHARAFPRPFLRFVKKAHGVLVFSAPVVFFTLYGLGLPGTWDWPTHPGWLWLPNLYTLSCWIMAFLVVPFLTVRRLLRKRPASVVKQGGQIVDVARELGHAPVGDDKHSFLARLPYNQIFQVEFSEKTFRLPQLPGPWDGLKVLHLTDLHMCGTPDKQFFRYVMDRCNDWQPDIVAITGDIVDSHTHHRWILPVLGRLRWRLGAFAILGNHDSWQGPEYTRRRLRRLGIHVLENRSEQIDVRGQPLVVVGHEGPWFRPEPDLTRCPTGTFRLCLSHTPDNIVWARRHDIDLVLAGHNHGGQIRFPLIGSILVPSRYSRRYDCGTFHEGKTVMHVSRGLAGQHPIRLNCHPEATLITLQAVPAPTASAADEEQALTASLP